MSKINKSTYGEVAERLNAAHSKCALAETSTWVQIPPSPLIIPIHQIILLILLKIFNKINVISSFKSLSAKSKGLVGFGLTR